MGESILQQEVYQKKKKIDVEMDRNHIMGPGDSKTTRYKELSIPSCQACQGKAFISWGQGKITSLGGMLVKVTKISTGERHTEFINLEVSRGITPNIHLRHQFFLFFRFYAT